MTFERITVLALLLVLVLILFRPQQQIRIEMPNTANANGQVPLQGSGDILSVIHNRKSVRNYTSDPVSLEELHTLVRAGFAAPTAINRQPWEFVVITERKKLDALSELLAYGKMLKNAPAAIVVCADSNKAVDEDGAKMVFLDCAAACENILLAAEGTGLGAVWCAAYPYDDYIVGVRSILNLPREIIPVTVISIGRPTGVDRPKDKYKPEKMHFQTWGNPFTPDAEK